jgi:hypothetical protein
MLIEYIAVAYIVIGLFVSASKAHKPDISDAEWILRQLAIVLLWPVLV